MNSFKEMYGCPYKCMGTPEERDNKEQKKIVQETIAESPQI